MLDALQKSFKAVVVGASAGAVEALITALGPVPAAFRLPIVVVVHIPSDQESVLPQILEDRCLLAAREACDKEPLEPATIYVAPPDYHLLVEKNETLSLSSDEPVRFSRPSIDVLFETAADCFGPSLLGIVLTGGNADGAAGLRAILDAGGSGIVQSPGFAYCPVMPEAALQACPEATELPLDGIARFLQTLAAT